VILDKSKIKLYSSVGSRASFGLACLELVKENKNLMVLTSDVSTSAGLDRFKSKHTENYIDVGIAEQNLIGVATGLSTCGYNVFTTTFAPFQTMRCLEQIKVNIGYMKKKITMVGLASGVVLGTLGFTHCCIEDISLMRTIPGMTVLSPADCGEVVKSTFAAARHDGPVYIRLTGSSNNPIIYSDDYKFEIGKSIRIREGDDISIFATGSMVYNSIKASEILKKHNLEAAVINVHTIKPIDKETINKYSKKKKLIVTVEEHSAVGGLGSAVSETNASLENTARQLFISLPDEYLCGGEYLDLLKKCNLNSEGIAQSIIKNLNVKG
jgi:transketolase